MKYCSDCKFIQLAKELGLQSPVVADDDKSSSLEDRIFFLENLILNKGIHNSNPQNPNLTDAINKADALRASNMKTTNADTEFKEKQLASIELLKYAKLSGLSSSNYLVLDRHPPSYTSTGVFDNDNTEILIGDYLEFSLSDTPTDLSIGQLLITGGVLMINDSVFNDNLHKPSLSILKFSDARLVNFISSQLPVLTPNEI